MTIVRQYFGNARCTRRDHRAAIGQAVFSVGSRLKNISCPAYEIQTVSWAGNTSAATLPVACRAACVRHRNDEYLSRLDLVDDAIGKSLQHGEAMVVIIARKQFWSAVNQSQEVFHFCLKPRRRSRTACLIPGKSSILFSLGLGVKYDISHRLSPGLGVSLRPRIRERPDRIAARPIAAG